MPFKYADIEREYAENKNLKKEDVVYLQQWMQKQPHLPPVHELELIFFLRSCLYSTEKAKITIDNFFTLRANKDVFVPVDLKRLKVVMEGAYYVLLPKLTPNGYQVLYEKINMSSNDYIFSDHMAYIDSVSKLYLLENGSIEGLVCILDLDGYTFGHLTKVPLGSLKKYIMYLQEALPVRLISIHFINAGPLIDKIFMMVKPLIKKELHDIMHVHTNNLETLHPFVPVDCLPSNLGGSGRSIAELHEQQTQMVINNVDFLKKDLDKVADESKREDKSKSINKLFGVDGSFKKLEID